MAKLYSRLPSTDATWGMARWGGIANPVGNTLDPTRETAPMEKNAPPRVMHPKLNTKPWSTSMAVKRSEPRSVKKVRNRKNRGYRYGGNGA